MNEIIHFRHIKVTGHESQYNNFSKMDISQSFFFFLYFTVNFGSEDEGKNSSTKI